MVQLDVDSLVLLTFILFGLLSVPIYLFTFKITKLKISKGWKIVLSFLLAIVGMVTFWNLASTVFGFRPLAYIWNEVLIPFQIMIAVGIFALPIMLIQFVFFFILRKKWQKETRPRKLIGLIIISSFIGSFLVFVGLFAAMIVDYAIHPCYLKPC